MLWTISDKERSAVMRYGSCTMLIWLLGMFYVVGQDKTEQVLNDNKLYNSINAKVLSLQRDVEERSLKALQRLQKQEAKLQKKLALKDSLAAKKLFAQTKYAQLTEQLEHPTVAKKMNEYIPQFDSLKTSLKFLENLTLLSAGRLPAISKGEGAVGDLTPALSKGEGVVGAMPNIGEKLCQGEGVGNLVDKIKNVNLNITGLETKMQQAEEIKNYIKQRKELLKEQLGKFGMLKDMKNLNKEAYYYQQQLAEYKNLLKDPKKIEQKALDALKKMPAFSSFMQKNSQLAQLFGMPADYGSAESLVGLQTRASIQNLLTAKFSGSGVNPQQYIGEQVQQVQRDLTPALSKGEGGIQGITNIKNKLSGGDGDVGGAGGFTPNGQKTKTFLKRLEYGANIQTLRPNGLLPVTSDLALTVGYKLNDKSVIGVGGSYKMGWGNGFSSIKISHQGVGLRSYVDYKVKGGWWLTGGYELNYQQEFEKLAILKDLSNWQRSGLLGLTKKYKIGKKTNNMQLLWDFLSYQQVPSTQPIVFRVGVGF